MPDPTHNTLEHLLLVGDRNLRDYGISDLAQATPLLMALVADYASHGTQHKYTVESGAPAVGFRGVNRGVTQGKSTDRQVTIDLKRLTANDQTDIAIADADPRGHLWYVGRECVRKLRAALVALEAQIIYGVDNGDPDDGFVGLSDAFNVLGGYTIDGTNGGSGAGNRTSIWFLRSHEAGDGVQLILGNDGEIVLGDPTKQQIPDANGKLYPAYCTDQEGWCGLQVGGAHDVGRLANIAADSTLNDQIIRACLRQWPVGKKPNLIVCSQTAHGMWQDSRTATNATGVPAPPITEFDGCTVLQTDAILDTEAVVAAP